MALLAIALYREMQAAEKNYMATRSRPLLQSAINVGNQLSRRVWASPSFDVGQRQQVAEFLRSYDKVAVEVGDLDAQIRSLFKEFDHQDQAVNPISEELIALAKAEVQRAEAKLERTSQWTTLVKTLQEQAAIAESRLFHAIESMTQGFALYDMRDILVMRNSQYRSLLYPGMEGR